MSSARELAETVEDFDGFMCDLTDVLNIVKETNDPVYLERFIDRWECQAVSFNDVSLSGVLYADEI
ncbi:MAG: hypothetical protein WCT16_05160 [Candidatus Buchananbacteria bacterium]